MTCYTIDAYGHVANGGMQACMHPMAPPQCKFEAPIGTCVMGHAVGGQALGGVGGGCGAATILQPTATGLLVAYCRTCPCDHTTFGATVVHENAQVWGGTGQSSCQADSHGYAVKVYMPPNHAEQRAKFPSDSKVQKRTSHAWSTGFVTIGTMALLAVTALLVSRAHAHRQPYDDLSSIKL